jgi:hypothetical protein
MAQRGTYFDPNLLVLHNHLDNRTSYAFNEQALATLETGLAPTVDALRRARAHHVKIMFGTDAVSRRAWPQRRGVCLPGKRRPRKTGRRARQRHFAFGWPTRHDGPRLARHYKPARRLPALWRSCSGKDLPPLLLTRS